MVKAVQPQPPCGPYTLPVEALHSLAQAAGLEWVHSDAGKVAQVQAQIAAMPPAIHVPRERPAPIVLNEGTLILVETRRDLRTVVFPFDTAQTHSH
jgi:ribonuclease E